MAALRGADLLVRTLAAAGVRNLFSLSGNHVMPVYDAVLDARLKIVHTRHEGAAVHMADAWARLTGEPGVVLLTGGPGHANGVGALYTALAADSPVVMLSGHAPLSELGRGAFQEMRQADMAAPAAKASWTAQSADQLGEDMARAIRLATSGRAGPVHVSLPVDLLEAKLPDGSSPPAAAAFQAPPAALADDAADAVIAALKRARRPLVLTGPQTANAGGRELRERLAQAIGTPVICMESPRGVNDPCLGAFAETLAQADFIVLLGKQPDFTLRFGKPVAADCRFAIIDPDAEALARAQHTLGDAQRVALAVLADTSAAAVKLGDRASGKGLTRGAWAGEVEAAVRYRPQTWDKLAAAKGGPAHPVAVGRAVQQLIDRSRDAVLVSDGGEFGQWAQACVTAPARVINGAGGSIGSALPFALAARMARPNATVVTMSGDGAFGFHLTEFDTATREKLAFVAVVGNDACWNAEHQIQLRAYGPERAHSCELLPARYDQAAAAFGAHGEFVTQPADLPAALERAAKSGRAACVNVLTQRIAAPNVARGVAKATAGAH